MVTDDVGNLFIRKHVGLAVGQRVESCMVCGGIQLREKVVGASAW